MPFTVSPSSYVGGQLLASGFSQFGAGIGGGIETALKRYEDEKKQEAEDDAMVGYLAKNVPGSISPEALQRYHSMNRYEKSALVGAAKFGIANQLQQQQADWENRLRAAQANAYMQRETPFTPTTTTVRHPVTGEAIPMVSTSRGAAQIIPGSSPLAGQAVYDPQGNPIGVYDANGRVIRPPQPNPLLALFPGLGTPMQTGGAPGGAAPAAPAGTPPPMLARPAPDTTQTPAPPAAPAPAGGGNVAAATQIKAQFRAGQITREEAVRQLQALGFQ